MFVFVLTTIIVTSRTMIKQNLLLLRCEKLRLFWSRHFGGKFWVRVLHTVESRLICFSSIPRTNPDGSWKSIDIENPPSGAVGAEKRQCPPCHASSVLGQEIDQRSCRWSTWFPLNHVACNAPSSLNGIKWTGNESYSCLCNKGPQMLIYFSEILHPRSLD